MSWLLTLKSKKNGTINCFHLLYKYSSKYLTRFHANFYSDTQDLQELESGDQMELFRHRHDPTEEQGHDNENVKLNHQRVFFPVGQLTLRKILDNLKTYNTIRIQ